MKFHVSALCIAGLLVSGGVARADHTPSHTGMVTTRYVSHTYASPTAYWDDQAKAWIYAGERLYYRQIFWPDLPSEPYIADKLAGMIQKQRTEIAHLDAFGGRAQTAGWTNISTVYDHMERDHQRVVDFAADWLSDYGFPLPPQPAATVAFINATPHDTVHHMIDMHIKAFNETLAQLEGEKSHTVRGALLMAAATTARHISLLQTLDRDVEFGRRELTASLQSQMDSTFLADNSVELMTRIVAEERQLLGLDQPLAGTDVRIFENIVEVDRPVEVERVVERTVEVPVERVVERIVEKPVYIERTRVAGQRQVTPTRRVRRPAK